MRRVIKPKPGDDVVELSGMLSKSSSNDPKSSKGKWKAYFFVLPASDKPRLKWFKSESDYLKQMDSLRRLGSALSPKGDLLLPGCEIALTGEKGKDDDEPIFSVTEEDKQNAIFLRGLKEPKLGQWLSALAVGAAQQTLTRGRSTSAAKEVLLQSFPVGARVQVFSRTAREWQTGEVIAHDSHGMLRVKYGETAASSGRKKTLDPRDPRALDQIRLDTGVTVEFTESGPLGVVFASDSMDGPPWIKSVKPDTQAAAFPELVPGLCLESVNEELVASMQDATTKIKAAGRPVTLVFRDGPEEQGSGSEEAITQCEEDVKAFLATLGCADASAVVAAFVKVHYLPSTWVTELEQMQSSGDLSGFLDSLNVSHDVPQYEPSPDGKEYRIVFTDPGPLGLSFGSHSDQGQPWIKTVKPNTQAASCPQLQVGMCLESVNGEKVRTFTDAMSKLKGDGRPLTLVFREEPERSVDEFEQEVQAFLDASGLSVNAYHVVDAFLEAGYDPSAWILELEDMQSNGELITFLGSVGAAPPAEADAFRDVEKFLRTSGSAVNTAHVIDGFVAAGYDSATWLPELEAMETSGDLDSFLSSVATSNQQHWPVADVQDFLASLGVTGGTANVIDAFVQAGYEPSTWVSELEDMEHAGELETLLDSVGAAVGMGSTVDVPAPNAMQAELRLLKLSVLKKRAQAAGVDAKTLEAVDDEDDVKQAVISLILAHEDPGKTLEAELQSLKMSALKKRALLAGIDEEALESVDDSDGGKSSLIDLVVFHEQPPDTKSTPGLLSVVFTQPGPLGLSFTAKDHPTEGRPWIKAVQANTQAAAFPQLVVGLYLESVNGKAVDNMADALAKITAAARPTTLVFRDASASKDPRRSAETTVAPPSLKFQKGSTADGLQANAHAAAVSQFLERFGCAHMRDSVTRAFREAQIEPSAWVDQLQHLYKLGAMDEFLQQLRDHAELVAQKTAATSAGAAGLRDRQKGREAPAAETGLRVDTRALDDSFTVVFMAPGPLGLSFASTTGAGTGVPQVKSVKPNTPASEFPQIAPGHYLCKVNGDTVQTWTQAMHLIKHGGRPLRLTFSAMKPAESPPDGEHNRAQSLPKQTSPPTAVDATSSDEDESDDGAGVSPSAKTAGEAAADAPTSPSDGILAVKIVRCYKLLAADKSNTSDPYVRIRLGSSQQAQAQTDVKRKTLKPEFHQDFDLPLIIDDVDKDAATLFVDVWDWDRGAKDDFIGGVEINLAEIFADGWHGKVGPKAFALDDRHGRLGRSERRQVEMLRTVGDETPYGLIELQLSFRASVKHKDLRRFYSATAVSAPPPKKSSPSRTARTKRSGPLLEPPQGAPPHLLCTTCTSVPTLRCLLLDPFLGLTTGESGATQA